MNWIAGLAALGGAVVGGTIAGVTASVIAHRHHVRPLPSTMGTAVLVGASLGAIVGAALPEQPSTMIVKQ